jgi:hypothetical protein
VTDEPLTTVPEGVLFPLEDRLVGPQALELARPVRHGERELERLELRPLAGKHVRALATDWTGHAAFLSAAGLLSGLPDGVFDQLEGGDVAGVVDLVGRMLWPVFDVPSSWLALPEGDPRRLEAYPRLAAPFELELEQPVRGAKDEYSRLTFHAMTGRVARQCPLNLGLGRLPWLVCQLTGASPKAVDELTGRDLNRALVIAQSFFGASPSKSGRG